VGLITVQLHDNGKGSCSFGRRPRCRSYHLCGLGAATTVAVETVALRHLEAQISTLRSVDSAAVSAVRSIIDDERTHLDRAGSSAHGAGRLMSRTAARRSVTTHELQRQMAGIWYDYRHAEQLRDEAPSAYKDILAQLGWQDRTFLEESVDALLCALRDPDDEVVQSAIFALGDRASPRAIEALLPFVEHPCADFRYASVHGLMPHDTPTVVDALIKLCRDADRDVRDWATFTLGSQFESDSPSLRAALHERLTDADPEIRGEDAVYFRGSVKSAIAACEGRRASDSATLQ
jgi:HEAT repeats/tRNA-splicing ligase RtcB/Ubiquinone biosynthesis protein COQ7